jgi:hypothetical protein
MTNRDRPLEIPYTQIPHGLWTADLTPKAALLLGWLHSHADNYLERLSLTRIGKEFGGGRKSATRLTEQLDDAGYLKLNRDVPGISAHVVLLSGPWEALTRVSGGLTPPSQDDAPTCVTVTHPPASGGRTIEEQLEAQPKTQSEEDHSAASFGDFWTLYPRKVGKADARKSWGRMSEDQRKASLSVIESHTAMWVAEGRGTAHVPHASTWLNRESWEDEVGFVPTRDVRQVNSRATRNTDAMQRFMERQGDGSSNTPIESMFAQRKEIR